MDKIEFFDKVYRTYDKVRPGYPDKLFSDIFTYKNVGKGSRVFEIGIGTGKATQPFIDRQCQVASVDPGKKMARFMQEKYKEYPDFSCYNFTFEKYMGFNNTFDLIYSATAIHHMDEESTYNKIFKLLKNGGAFARFAYHAGKDESRPELMDKINELYAECMNNSADYKEFSQRDVDNVAAVAGKYGFINPVTKIYTFTKDFTADEYIKLLSTYPDHMRLEEEIRKEFFSEIKKAIKKHGGIITVNYTCDLHLCTKP